MHSGVVSISNGLAQGRSLEWSTGVKPGVEHRGEAGSGKTTCNVTTGGCQWPIIMYFPYIASTQYGNTCEKMIHCKTNYYRCPALYTGKVLPLFYTRVKV